MRSSWKNSIRVVAAIAVAAGGVLAVREFSPWASAVPVDANCPNTAAAAFNWGQPNRTAGFDDPGSLAGWQVYDSPGHDGNGRRTPGAVAVTGGTMTITADAQGNSGGMAWNPGQLHGRWEVCVKSSPSAPSYHSVALLWPDAEDWPTGGEIDFMEIVDPSRQFVDGFLHYGPNNDLEQGGVSIDATQWHSWAVEWTPERLAFFVDGRPWWETRNAANLPPRPMHLCLQLDNFGGDTSAGGQMMVDWARQYPL